MFLYNLTMKLSENIKINKHAIKSKKISSHPAVNKPSSSPNVSKIYLSS